MRVVGSWLLLLAIVVGTASFADEAVQYPVRSVRVIVGYAAGSGPDLQARLVAQQLSATLGQQFFVENRPGANGTIAARTVVQSEPDGYTLLFSSSSIAPTRYLYRNLGYDIVTDLSPVASVGILDGIFMLVEGSSPIHSVPEFIAYAKQHRVLYGSPGVGNELHVASETFAVKAGISMEHVPYKGASEVLAALLGGSIQMMFVTPPSVVGVLREGKVRAIGFTGHKPFPAFPDVPLVSASVPDFPAIGSWGMFFAPVRTPQALVDKLNAAIRQAVDAPAVAAILQRDGYVPDHRTAAETAAFFKAEVERAVEATKAAHIQPN
jgi:tripartite-type tricarboxylate transporter receptor subunit TctC